MSLTTPVNIRIGWNVLVAMRTDFFSRPASVVISRMTAVCIQLKMSWIDTRGIFAVVVDDRAFGYWTVKLLVDETMR